MCRDYPDNGDGSNSHIYGYRLIVQREGKRVRLFSRNGYDWSHSFPLIVEAALRIAKAPNAWAAGIAPDHGNTNAAKRLYTPLRRRCILLVS